MTNSTMNVDVNLKNGDTWNCEITKTDKEYLIKLTSPEFVTKGKQTGKKIEVQTKQIVTEYPMQYFKESDSFQFVFRKEIDLPDFMVELQQKLSNIIQSRNN